MKDGPSRKSIVSIPVYASPSPAQQTSVKPQAKLQVRDYLDLSKNDSVLRMLQAYGIDSTDSIFSD
jgi:hypothetical protein